MTRKSVIHYLPESDNGKVVCGLDVLKVHYHCHRKQNTICKNCLKTINKGEIDEKMAEEAPIRPQGSAGLLGIAQVVSGVPVRGEGYTISSRSTRNYLQIRWRKV